MVNVMTLVMGYHEHNGGGGGELLLFEYLHCIEHPHSTHDIPHMYHDIPLRYSNNKRS